jgi:spoIIIJ-associated protein
MNIPTRITVRRASGDGAADADPPVVLDVGGDDLGLLIGWRGETLRSIQTVVNLMMGDGENLGRRLIIDVERYRVRRERQVVELARRIAHRVKRSGERCTLDPMHAYERRAVHVALADDPGVRTESVGKDLDRSIVVHPTGPAQTGLGDEDSARPRGDGHRPPRREFRS